MARQKHYEQGPGQTNEETTDAAAEAGSDHNESLGQRPAADGTANPDTDDQAAIESLQRTSDATAKLVTAGQTTTTTPDSVTGQTADTSGGPGELDKMTAEERLEKVRGWAKGKRLGGPMSADWQELDQILGSPAAGEARRP